MASLELFDLDWREVWGAEIPESAGAVFTRPEVVELILDLAGYVPATQRLAAKSLLEPGCGDGAFLDLVIERLLASEVTHLGKVNWRDPLLENAICAADISESSITAARALIVRKLVACGCQDQRARELSLAWTLHTDFLLHPWDRRFDYVVGNPPYVRLEELPRHVLGHYRQRFETATDRADLYVPFFEQSLRLLTVDGVLAFICANRFARNQYGAALRRLMTSRFHVSHYINLEHTQPFQEDVSAYPAIIVVDNRRGEPTLAATLQDCAPSTLSAIAKQAQAQKGTEGPLSEFRDWYPDGSPWRTTSASNHSILSKLEADFALLEASGPDTKAGIGVATGADSVFVVPGKHLEIEESRQIPLALAQDVRSNSVVWSGHYLVNPFAPEDTGALVRLDDYPGLRAYLEASRLSLGARHVAKSRPSSWFRTIDRIWPALQRRPKLLIPDIQPGGVVAVDGGELYPHHNLYWITSTSWPLGALQAILRSSYVLLQVRSLSVEMRGGSLRYQTQTLRRLRVPALTSLDDECLESLAKVSLNTDRKEIDAVVAAAYGFDL